MNYDSLFAPTYMTREKADFVAELLTSSEYDDWTYVAVHKDNVNEATVEVYDEDGHLVGMM